jgi:transposase-like protein
MKHRRSFAVELMRQIVEELLSGMSKPAQLTCRYEISSGFLYHWKEQYAKGRFDNEPGKEAALEDRAPTGTTGRQIDPGERVFKKPS